MRSEINRFFAFFTRYYDHKGNIQKVTISRRLTPGIDVSLNSIHSLQNKNIVEDLGDSIFVVSSMATFEAKGKTNNPDY